MFSIASTACPPCAGKHGTHTTAGCFGHIAQTPSESWKEMEADSWEGALKKSQGPTPLFQELEANFFR